MARARNLTGERFGSLVAIRDTGNPPGQGRQWQFHCDCGGLLIARVVDVIGNRGRRSCGCLARTGEYKRSPVYAHWKAMRQRCLDKNQKAYARYGGRGIAICAEWSDFLVFRDWALANGFEPGLSIDRINSDGNYEPANCRWATATEQHRNRRATRWVEWRGERLPLMDACRMECVNYWTVRSRLKAGKSLAAAMVGGRDEASEGPILRAK